MSDTAYEEAILTAAAKLITRDEALSELRRMAGPDGLGDIENAHSYADQLLLRLIADPEIAAAYVAVPKWYA